MKRKKKQRINAKRQRRIKSEERSGEKRRENVNRMAGSIIETEKRQRGGKKSKNSRKYNT